MSATDEAAGNAADQQARLRKPLVHEYVAEQLRREIALGLFAPRKSLPPERESSRPCSASAS